MRTLCLVAGALLVEAGCRGEAGGAAVQAPTTTVVLPVASSQVPPRSPASPPVTAIHDYVGRYRISGTARSDECGNVFLAAHHIEVTSSEELRADVVNRTYRAHVAGATLVAEGDFDAQAACGQLHEQWTFTRTEGGLEGELVSEWPTPPDCARTCRVVFEIHALRLADRDESHDEEPDPPQIAP
jgi:hypothetical protein